MAQVAPSILSADFARLGEEVGQICDLGADILHIDVMDGDFVPNISFGSAVMKSLNGYATKPYDVHLMVREPIRYIADFMTDNTEYITVHAEACSDLQATLDAIHGLGVKAGIAVNPETSLEAAGMVLTEAGASAAAGELLRKADMILVMSVHPGFGGQKFIPECLEKVRQLSGLREAEGLGYVIEIDGGISPANAAEVRAAGADILVAGSAVFKSDDRAGSMNAIRG